jgi:cobyrinic acid a,c-diamide synthase
MTRGIVIAAPYSGSGKTTVTLGLIRALTRQFRVIPFKIGPDYIDPSYHQAAAKNESHNLDLFLLGEENLKKIFFQSIQKGEMAIVEGVMGLFDGLGTESWASTAHVAKILKLPVILVVDVRSMSTSAAALVHGFQTYDPELQLVGVICNLTSSKTHYNHVKKSIERDCNLPVVGHLPFKKFLDLPERQLGLIPAWHIIDIDKWLDHCADFLLKNVNLNQIIDLMKTLEKSYISSTFQVKLPPSETIRIGIAYDGAFHFYYSDGLETLRSAGAELVSFSPMNDKFLPEGLDGLILGGGFPETNALGLSYNQSMRNSIRSAIENGLPTYAECGGMMYLTQEIEDYTHCFYPMVGIFPVKAIMGKRLQHFGYVEVKVTRNNVLAPTDTILHGHEFHYSELIGSLPISSYKVKKPNQKNTWDSGFVYKNCLASYVHLHLSAYPELISNFLNHSRLWKKNHSYLI